jgi:TolB protein
MTRRERRRPGVFFRLLLAAAAVWLTAGGDVTSQTPLGYFENSGDIGQPAIAGSTVYDAAQQRYTITGSGTNMWGARDEFQMAWRRLTGDFILRTHVSFVGKGLEPHRKIGWIARRTLDADSAYVDATSMATA